jgi:para-aminobenzoate synthetase component 1
MELNIVIRSMLLLDGVAHVQAGAGIVADSQPARELDESSRKAQALWVALDRVEAGRDPKPDLNRG